MEIYYILVEISKNIPVEIYYILVEISKNIPEEIYYVLEEISINNKYTSGNIPKEILKTKLMRVIKKHAEYLELISKISAISKIMSSNMVQERVKLIQKMS